MDHDAPLRVYGKGPGYLSVFFISLITSSLVVVAFHAALRRGLLPRLQPVPAVQTAPVATPTPPAAATPTTARVPILAGLSVSDATELVQARGLRLIVGDKRTHEELAPGLIISQQPPAEAVAPLGANVEVVVSSGRTAVVMLPDLTGKTLEEAVVALESTELKVGVVDGPDAGERIVESTDPPPGRLVPRGTTVALVLALPAVVVPNVIGAPFARAKKQLEELGLEVGKVRERYDSDRNALVILEQTPTPGEAVSRGSKVDLIRNEGD